MPCHDGPPDPNTDPKGAYIDMREQNDNLARMLCEACRLIEKLNSISEISPKLLDWWKHHRAMDKREGRAMNFHPFNDEGVKQRSEAIEKLAAEITAKHAANQDALTRDQLATVIEQAIECGDIQRHIRQGDGAQAVVYVPFAREQELNSEITALNLKLAQLGFPWPKGSL